MKRYSTTNQIVFDGFRGSGKTLQLIYYAIDNDMTIVSQNPRNVLEMAHNRNLAKYLRRPISYNDMLNNKDRGSSTKGYLIDDVEVLLNSICHGKCGGFTHSVRRMDLNFMYKSKHLTLTNRVRSIFKKIRRRLFNGQ